MDTLIDSLGPVFIASMALQQLLEIADPWLDKFIKSKKAIILSGVSFLVGLLLAFGLGLRVLAPFGYSVPAWIDGLITALVLTGGTKWINDLVKVIGYKKLELHSRTRLVAGEVGEL